MDKDMKLIFISFTLLLIFTLPGCLNEQKYYLTYSGVDSTIRFLSENETIEDNRTNFDLLIANLESRNISIIQYSLNQIDVFNITETPKGISIHGQISINETNIVLSNF